MKKYYLNIDTPTIIKQLSAQPEALLNFINQFNMDIPINLTSIPEINQILTIYKYYYTNILFFKKSSDQSEIATIQFSQHFFKNSSITNFEQLEQHCQVICEKYGYHCQTGKTNGIYGPYIWKTNQEKTYTTEVLNKHYHVKVIFMSDFIASGWLRYYSLGAYGTAGWADKDGTLYAVDSVYPDKTSPDFLISLLKHETQHLIDYQQFPFLTSETLEFRAKIIELLYYNNPNKLNNIIDEAKNNPNNGHAYASYLLLQLFKKISFNITNINDQNYDKIKPILKTIFDTHTNYLRILKEKSSLKHFVDHYTIS